MIPKNPQTEPQNSTATIKPTIKRHVPVESHQLQRTPPHQAQHLRRIQNQPDVVERRGHEAARADPPLPVLVPERFLQEQGREEDADARDEELQLRAPVRAGALVRDVIVD